MTLTEHVTLDQWLAHFRKAESILSVILKGEPPPTRIVVHSNLPMMLWEKYGEEVGYAWITETGTIALLTDEIGRAHGGPYVISVSSDAERDLAHLGIFADSLRKALK